MSNKFSELSRQLTKNLNSKTKKNEGIFFTHPIIIKEIVDYIDNNNLINTNKKFKILEPSCGSGEFINYIDNKWENKEIHAVELNKKIYDAVSKETYKSSVQFYNCDFLKCELKTKFHLIIGNPPYFVMNKKDVDEKYYPYIHGRPNIFAIFIIHSLQLLEPNGILAFVLPNTFFNSHYYEKIRRYIFDEFYLINIINYQRDGRFMETSQKTSAFIIQKKQINNFILTLNNQIIFNDDKQKLINLSEKSKTLDELNFKVLNGTVVWNYQKKYLTDDSKETLLIYDTNLENNEFNIVNFKNEQKKQYILTDGYTEHFTEPCIAITRGYGNGDYKFNYALINFKENKEYVLENHILWIKYKDIINNDKDKNKVINKLKKIMKSFANPKTKEYIETFSGNNALNTKELQFILPIYGF